VSGRASVGVRTEWFAFLKNRLRLGRRRIRHGNSPIERHVGAGSSLPSAEAGGPRPPTLTRRRTTLAWMMYVASTESLTNVRANNSVCIFDALGLVIRLSTETIRMVTVRICSPRHLLQVRVREVAFRLRGYDDVVHACGRLVDVDLMSTWYVDPHLGQGGLGIGFKPGLEIFFRPRLGDELAVLLALFFLVHVLSSPLVFTGRKANFSVGRVADCPFPVAGCRAGIGGRPRRISSPRLPEHRGVHEPEGPRFGPFEQQPLFSRSQPPHGR